jgi:hypothetical protein
MTPQGQYKRGSLITGTTRDKLGADFNDTGRAAARCCAVSGQSVGMQDRVQFAHAGGLGMTVDDSGGDAADTGAVGDFGGSVVMGRDQRLCGLLGAAATANGPCGGSHCVRCRSR